jgi:hypothetical protein
MWLETGRNPSLEIGAGQSIIEALSRTAARAVAAVERRTRRRRAGISVSRVSERWLRQLDRDSFKHVAGS